MEKVFILPNLLDPFAFTYLINVYFLLYNLPILSWWKLKLYIFLREHVPDMLMIT